jgi:hypothetical protein
VLWVSATHHTGTLTELPAVLPRHLPSPSKVFDFVKKLGVTRGAGWVRGGVKGGVPLATALTGRCAHLGNLFRQSFCHGYAGAAVLLTGELQCCFYSLSGQAPVPRHGILLHSRHHSSTYLVYFACLNGVVHLMTGHSWCLYSLWT